MARQTLAYGLGNGLSTVMLAAVGPILTHFLTPTDYGIGALFTSAFGFLFPLVGLGTVGAVRRRYYEPDRYDYPSYVWSTAGVAIASVALLTLSLLASYPLWETEAVHWAWVLVFLPWLAGRHFTVLSSVLYQVRSSPLGVGVLSWVQSAVTVIGTLALVLIGLGWEARVLGQVVACSLTGLASLIVMQRLLASRPRWSKPMATDAIRYGVPAIPYALLDRWMQYGDRMLMAALTSVDQAGLFALGAQLSALSLRIGSPLNYSWQPWLFSQLREGTELSQQRIVLAFRAASVGLLLLGLLFWLGAKWLFPVLIGDRYTPALTFLPWLCLGVALRGICNLLTGFVLYSESTGILARTSVFVALFHVLSTATLVLWLGPIGAAFASCLAYAFRLALIWRAARALVPLKGI